MAREDFEGHGIGRKDYFVVFFLLFNALTWLYMIPMIINNILDGLNAINAQEDIIWATYYAAIIGSSIFGSILSSKISRLKFLYFWITFGIITSSLPALLNNITIIHALIISLLFGTSFGLGMPSCLAYFADYTLIENRGRISGITLLITNLSAPLFAIAFDMSNLRVNSTIFAVWRASGLIILFLKPKERMLSETPIKNSFVTILRDKPFVLYFIAWFMFMLIDRSETPVLRFFLGDFHYYIVAPIIGSFSAFIAGILVDRIGRKRMVLYAFVTFGIAYAVIGIVPAAGFSRYFFLAIESVSNGILAVTFILILWGDLSQSATREKYYAIGEIPIFLTSIIQLFAAPYFMSIPNTSAFSLASFFLFLAVLPLLYAPETLPEKKIELRRLKKYVEAAKKVQEKYTEKVATS